MKYKLTNDQFQALLKLFKEYILPYKPKGFSDKLGHALLLQVYAKLYKKAVFNQLAYSINLTEPEALAVMLFWGNYPLPATMVYETNLVQLLINQAHQKYC